MSNFLAAAKATSKPPLPHQQAAWNYAWDLLSTEEKATFLDKFRADPPAKITSQWQPAANLIREFEGLVLTAYPDPATGSEPWTIGYGFTFWLDGSKVKPGDTITKNSADGMLENLIETKVVPTLTTTIPGWKTLSISRQNALISFSWNVGWHFYGTTGFETISKCLRESNYDAVPDAMMLYINPGSNVEAGLRRRRQAEASLWGISKKTTSVLLKVPYESQNDNISGTGYRECFSSSCAMIAKYYGKIKNDDEYNKIRSKYGDTTDSQAQLQALRSLGLQAQFKTNCAPGLLEAELRAGRPIAVGWLHQGPYNAPIGGGHWSVVIGFTEDGYWIFNDPNGEADLVNGGYVSNKGGASVKYSKLRFNRRWEADGAGTGWAILVRS
jgi:GH24 family phage-related lysozyme (muramidase)